MKTRQAPRFRVFAFWPTRPQATAQFAQPGVAENEKRETLGPYFAFGSTIPACSEQSGDSLQAKTQYYCQCASNET